MKKKKLKLSEALRIGASFREQTFHFPFSFNTNIGGESCVSGLYISNKAVIKSNNFQSCSVGAIVEAIATKKQRKEMLESVYGILIKYYPGIDLAADSTSGDIEDYPYRIENSKIFIQRLNKYFNVYSLANLIFKLNDSEKLTREEIANILEDLGY